MVKSPNSRQLAVRAKANISGHSRSLLQKQINAFQKVAASTKQPPLADEKSVAKRDTSSIAEMAKIAGKARGMTNMRQFQSASNVLRKKAPKNIARAEVGTSQEKGSGESPTANHELVKQNMQTIGQTLYGVAVSPQVGPDGEVFFASENKRYANVGNWYQGKESGRGETQTSFLLEPPFNETVVDIDPALEELERRGFILEFPSPPPKRGRQPSPVYDVRPT